MNYHMIRTDDMLNGDGLRVIIFLSGCEHHCKGCHNPETWDINSGKEFTLEATEEILKELNKDYISGITFSGGDPLHEKNLIGVYSLISKIKEEYPNKTIWLYTGYEWKDIDINIANIVYPNLTPELLIKQARARLVSKCDVLVDGKFIQSLADVNFPWVGSINQRVIDVQKSIKENKIILWNSKEYLK